VAVHHLAITRIAIVVLMAACYSELQPAVCKAGNSDPNTMTLEKALASTPNSDKWVAVLKKEIHTLEEMGGWEEVPESDVKGKIVPVHIVMKLKRKPSGRIDKFKSCVVAQGDLLTDNHDSHIGLCLEHHQDDDDDPGSHLGVVHLHL